MIVATAILYGDTELSIEESRAPHHGGAVAPTLAPYATATKRSPAQVTDSQIWALGMEHDVQVIPSGDVAATAVEFHEVATK
jgi:hypothetical protein